MRLESASHLSAPAYGAVLQVQRTGRLRVLKFEIRIRQTWCEALSSGGQICRFRGFAEIYDHAQFFDLKQVNRIQSRKTWVDRIPNFLSFT